MLFFSRHLCVRVFRRQQKSIQFIILYACECFATNKSLFKFIMHFFSRRWLIRNPSIIKGRKMFVKHAVDSAFSEETSVMSLHGELRNIIFDDSPLPVIQRNLVLASRPWSIYTTSSGKCVALHFSETKFYIWILKETHVWGGLILELIECTSTLL